MQSKEDFLCVIHHKMNHSKIALPRLEVKNKIVSKLGHLLSQPHFGISVRVKPTLPKVGSRSLPELPKIQSSS